METDLHIASEKGGLENMRVQFEYTHEDLLDATRRFLARSKVMRSLKWKGMLATGVFTGLILFAVFYRSPVIGGLMALAAAVIAAFLFPLFHRRETDKRLRQYYRENMGNGPWSCEVEVTQSGLSVKQTNCHITYQWKDVSDISETSDSVDIFTRAGGGVIVRNRAFQTDADRSKFVRLTNEFLNDSNRR